MIVCHRHQFIFIKTRKTASTSVEVALSRFCSAADIVTGILRQEEPARIRAGGRVGMDMPKGFPDMTAAEAERVRNGHKVPVGLVNHSPAEAIRTSVGPELWDRYVKITIERNPWERLVAQYYWFHTAKPTHPPRDFDAFLAFLESDWPDYVSNWPIYTVADQPAADEMLFTETLGRDIARLRQRLGIDVALPDQKLKAAQRNDTRSYRELLPDSVAARVGELCRNEIAAFGYRF